jgi:hypothetical protein
LVSIALVIYCNTKKQIQLIGTYSIRSSSQVKSVPNRSWVPVDEKLFSPHLIQLCEVKMQKYLFESVKIAFFIQTLEQSLKWPFVA